VTQNDEAAKQELKKLNKNNQLAANKTELKEYPHGASKY